jgi:hypothetical protein
VNHQLFLSSDQKKLQLSVFHLPWTNVSSFFNCNPWLPHSPACRWHQVTKRSCHTSNP